MKTLVEVIACCLALACSTAAQQKLWTWKPKNQNAYHVIRAVAMNNDGSAAFVVNEFQSVNDQATILIVWVNGQGKTIMSRKVTQWLKTHEVMPGHVAASYTPREDRADDFNPYSVAFLTNDHIVVTVPTNGSVATRGFRIYKKEDGKSPKLTVRDEFNATIFPKSSGFGGWIEMDQVRTEYAETITGQNGWFTKFKSLTAWKL